MPKLSWGAAGTKKYEQGVDRVVLFPTDEEGAYSAGVAWTGVTKISEKPSGAEVTKKYADNVEYAKLRSAEEYASTLEAYYYPDEFAECDGSAEIATGVTVRQQERKTFGLSYRTKLGNDIKNDNFGYIIHLVYGCMANPTEKDYETVNDSPDMATMSWDIDTTAVDVPGFKPSATLEINSTKVKPADLAKLEEALYGTETATSKLPTPAEVLAMVAQG